MLFTEINFAIFFLIVFIIYWLIANKNLKIQNILLLIASYVFYGWWDWRFLLLLVVLSFTNYIIGLKIEKNETNKKKKIWFIAGLIINIGILGIFKYFNFFIDTFISLVSSIGYDLPRSTTNIVLPLGISFYVFLSLSYIIDIYKKNLNANSRIVEVLLTLSFFPIILAGPIQRPASLLPQIARKREFNYAQAVDGLKQVLWGLFSKVVIADRLAFLVDNIFQNFSGYLGSTLLLGAIFFAVQVYADFSGYSNIAIGIAKLLGFSLMQNFDNPYFSRDITEFWKKWHISLTTWFRDYLFLPLSFAFSWRIKKERVLLVKTDMFIYIIASIITWFLTGLWHGANYSFIIWGMINGFLLIVYHLQRKPRKRLLKKFRISNNHFLLVFLETFFTLFIISIVWVFFRANSIEEADIYINEIFSKSLFSIPEIMPKFTLLTICIFFIIEWSGKESQYAIAKLGINWRKPLRYAIYYALISIIIWFSGIEQEFIYFQF